MIYLDNASTTKPNDQVIEEVIFTLRNCWSNPSNTYETTDFSPRDILDEAKNIIASSINCTKDEIYFTSGASEGNSWGMAQGDVCYYSPYEHHNYWAADEKSGLWDSIEERVCISDDDFLNYDCWGYTNDKWVYSHMLVSNITGEIFDVAPLFKHAKSNKGAKFFTLCDCTQAFGNMPIDVKELGCDMAVFSGHKFGAPKGIGFVYLSNEAPRPIIPLITGSQQFELRGGTENIPYIAGLGLAAELASQKIEHKTKICKTLNKVLKDSLDESGIPYFIPETKNKIESTTLFFLKNIESEVVQSMLADKKIYVGVGSGCNDGSLAIDPSIKALNVGEEWERGPIRISYSDSTTAYDVRKAIKEIAKIYKELA